MAINALFFTTVDCVANRPAACLARDPGEVSDWPRDEQGRLTLQTVVERVQPTVLIGTSTVAGAFNQSARHREDQRHCHVSCIFGQNTWSIGNCDGATKGGSDVNIIHAIAEISDQFHIFASLSNQMRVNFIRNRGNKHIRSAHGFSQFFLLERTIGFIKTRVE